MLGDEQQWYVQSGTRVQGPWSTLEVGRYLLLGRVRSTDRVSKDGELWEPVTQVPELIPEELLDLDSDTGWKQYLHTRARHDERGGGDTPVIARERRQIDESASADEIRQQWQDERQHPPVQSPNPSPSLLPVSLLGVTLAALLVVIYLNSVGGNAL